MRPYSCPFSAPTGNGKFPSQAGVRLALITGIFIACTLAARGQDAVQEEPLQPSWSDYTVGETNAAPPPPSLASSFSVSDSRVAVLGGGKSHSEVAGA